MGKRRAPKGIETFADLQTSPELVFRDFTSFFDTFNIIKQNKSGRVLLRGRRWGKTTLGNAWLAFLRKDERLFKGTEVARKGLFRKEPLIGIGLNVTEAKTLPELLVRFSESIQEGMELAQLPVTWHSPLQSLEALSQLNELKLLEAASVLLNSLKAVSRTTKRKFALFIDEYDYLVINALHRIGKSTTDETRDAAKDEYTQITTFFAELFTTLKALVDVVPFQFITGSSRISVAEFFSGGNYFEDMSSDPRLATVLGYTWEQIEKYFSTQLGWLERLHGKTRKQLRRKMEEWYDCHRWSYSSDEHVFNPWSVHKFISSGKFNPYWAGSGANTRLLDSKLLMKDLVKSLTLAHDEGACITIDREQLKGWLPRDGSDALTADAQKALLVGAGILAIHPNYVDPAEGSATIGLTIPNKDARAAIVKVLDKALALPQQLTSGAIYKRLQRNRIDGLFELLNNGGAFRSVVHKLSEEGEEVLEPELSAGFAAMMVMRMPENIKYRYERPIPKCKRPASVEGRKRGRRPTADHVIHVMLKKITHIIEFKRVVRGNVEEQLKQALVQAYDYRALVRDGFTGRFTAVIFEASAADPTRVVAIRTHSAPEMEAITNQ